MLVQEWVDGWVFGGAQIQAHTGRRREDGIEGF